MTNSYFIPKLEIEGKEINFYSPIKKILIVRNIVLVLLERVGVEVNEKKESLSQNIHAFDTKGNKLWTVQALDPFQGMQAIITGLFMRNDKVLAYVSWGVEYEIDLNDGTLINIPGQRPW